MLYMFQVASVAFDILQYSNIAAIVVGVEWGRAAYAFSLDICT
jgi:hypothetical protein